VCLPLAHADLLFTVTFNTSALLARSGDESGDRCVRERGEVRGGEGLAIGFLAEDTRAICRDQASCQVSPNTRWFGASHPATVKVLTGRRLFCRVSDNEGDM